MLDAIKNRRSIRFFRKDPIDENILMDIIKAGFSAPSAHNNKGWHLVCVKNKDLLFQISSIHRWSKMVKDIPALLVVCYDGSDLEDFWIEDSSAFMENMLIQATEYGIGNCWLGARGTEAGGFMLENKIREILSIPSEIKILGMCALGYTAKEFNFTKEINIEERLHFDRF